MAERSRIGRPTKLTPEVAAAIAEAIAKGNFARVAARAAGVGESTFYAWLQRADQCETDIAAMADAPLKDMRALAKKRGIVNAGRLGRERLIDALIEPELPFLEFREAIKKAEAEAEVAAVGHIIKAASEGNWQASAWYLERKYADRYGRTLRTEVSGPDGGAIRISGMSDEELLHELAKLEEPD